MDTYNPPRKKIPSTLNLCMTGICSLQTMGIGVMRMMKSVTTLAAPFPIKKDSIFIHFPVAVGSTY